MLFMAKTDCHMYHVSIKLYERDRANGIKIPDGLILSALLSVPVT